MSETIESTEVVEVTTEETVETETKTEETEKEPSWLKGRLDRHEKKIREEYKDYDQLKQLASDHVSEIEKKDSEISSLKEQMQQYEMDSVKTKAAIKYGIPLEMASRISGTDEESIIKDAEWLSSFFKKPSAPLATKEHIVSGIDGSLLKLSRSLSER